MSTELDQLEFQAAAVDAEATANEPGAVPEVEVTQIDAAAEVAALIQTIAGILTPAFPCLAGIYTESTCRSLGAATAPVMDKYGLSVGSLFEHWGAEITLAAAVIPVGLATVQGIKADIAARHVKPEPKPETDTAPIDTKGGYARARGALVISAP